MYVGLDIHSKQISVCVLDAQGRVTLRRQVRRLDQLLRLLEGLPRPWSVCYEASGGYGAIHDLLSPRAVRVQVAHPGKLRLICRSAHKNDRHDAAGACRAVPRPNSLLAADELTTSDNPKTDSQNTEHRFSGTRHVSRRERERDSGFIPIIRMGLANAVRLNGRNRIPSPGAPPRRVMPNGCLGNPALILAPDLDGDFLMDAD